MTIPNSQLLYLILKWPPVDPSRWWWQLDAGPSDGDRDDRPKVCLESKRRRCDGTRDGKKTARDNESAWILQLSSVENSFCLFFCKIKPCSISINHQTIKPLKPSKPTPRGKLLTTHPNWRCGAAASVAWCDRFRPGSRWPAHLFLAWCHGYWKAGGWDYRKPWISLEVVVISGS